jgi:hypothetical protein
MPQSDTASARCPNCRGEVNVPTGFTHGDHIKCSSCGTGLKVSRGEALRLLYADISPLKDALRESQERIERLEDELRGARGSVGMGVHGLYVGAFYVGYQLFIKDQDLRLGLFAAGLGLAAGIAVALEVLNYFFLTKRKRITRLAAEVEDERRHGRELRQRLRDATR